jgi:hypothetical protein
MIVISNTIGKELVLDNSDDISDVLIGISSDTLCIIKKVGSDYDLVEMIIHGDDPQGQVLSCCDEDLFLETITVIKNMINDGINPLKYIVFE